LATSLRQSHALCVLTRAFIGKPIRLAYLGDLQRYADALSGSPASCARRLLVVKSLLSFASRMGFTPFNIGAAIRPPRPDDRLAERILDERQVFVLLDAVEPHPRDHALIRLLYNGGLRVSEAVTLQWRNLVDGIVNVRGKGGRTRVVRLSRGTWDELQALRSADALGDDRVFPMTAWNAWDRVRRALPDWKRWSRRTSCGTRTGPTPYAAAPTSPRCARRSATRR
jgi:integrase